ncbi:beta-ketoacyl synthase N-terminal-like domain-containing protein [Amycolatopsis rhabdoformis]|uniref:Beta-ketoacyl synthase N-terminal-like domain-containing protein n=1 Tax=Amycolatopsis rhabdoformis TaxID=1448059 RepID=A0ABZ1I5G3_9PSEU|nr:beta-ketoacyl synthase N-terminal-like domain-containing protein [Amycolatopsis rhabdoformis]WSE29662.1 beta-ketoacyl synthase N-terminal-like domain-containing protein [Amycolatopsis rhabdoformis]
MTAATAVRPDPTTGVSTVDIVGCGVFSAAGRGLAPLAEAFALPPAGVPEPTAEPGWPALPTRPLPGFDPAALLGRKGLSRLTRTDQLVLAAVADALEDVGDGTRPAESDSVGPGPAESGIVTGTALGSPNAVLAFLRDTFEQASPYLVNPSHFPGTLMNSAAGKAAIRHGLTGLNATVSGGAMASLNALRYARTALLEGRARRLFTGGTEELSSTGAWAWHRGRALAAGTALAEGCAVFTLDAGSSARVLGRIHTVTTGFADPVDGLGGVSARLAATVREALTTAGLTPDDVTLVVPGSSGRRGWAAVEERGLREVFGAGPRLRTHRVLGETHSAGVALNLATVLAGWRYPWQTTGLGRVAVLTSAGFDGSVGCLVVTHP